MTTIQQTIQQFCRLLPILGDAIEPQEPAAAKRSESKNLINQPQLSPNRDIFHDIQWHATTTTTTTTTNPQKQKAQKLSSFKSIKPAKGTCWKLLKSCDLPIIFELMSIIPLLLGGSAARSAPVGSNQQLQQQPTTQTDTWQAPPLPLTLLNEQIKWPSPSLLGSLMTISRHTISKRVPQNATNKQLSRLPRNSGPNQPPDAQSDASTLFSNGLINDFDRIVLPSPLTDGSGQFGTFERDSRQISEALTNETTSSSASRGSKSVLDNVTVLSNLVNSNNIGNGNGNNSNNNSDSAKENLTFSSETERYILMVNFVAESAVFFIGSIGNGIVIAIILFFTKGNSVADVYIFNLAIADITFLAGLGFLFVTAINDHWIFGNIMCKMFMSLTALNQFASSLLLSLMSFDRYLAVCHPIFSQRYRHPRPAKFICFVLWIVCFILMIPIFIHARTDESNITCGIFWPDTGIHERVFTLYSFCIGFLLPLVLIVVFYRCVVVKLKSTASGTTSMHSERRTRNRETTNKRVSNLVKAIVTTYGVCWLPYWIGQMLIGFSESKDPMTYYTFNQIAACLTYLNSAVNPILYAFLSDSFRRRCSQFWQSLISFQLFKRRQNFQQAPPATQSSVTENHFHNTSHLHPKQQHHSLHENHSTYCNDSSNNNNNNNNTSLSVRQVNRDADFDAEDGTISGQYSLHATMTTECCSPAIKSKIDSNNNLELDNENTITIANEDNNNNSNLDEQTLQQETFRKKSPTTHLFSFRKLKFKRRKKKHSLVKLKHLGSTANGALMGQTVLLA